MMLYDALPLLAWLGTTEMVAILIVVLLLFGGTKIPQLMRGLGKGMGEFQKGIEEGKRNFDTAMREEPGDETGSESKSAPKAS